MQCNDKKNVEEVVRQHFNNSLTRCREYKATQLSRCECWVHPRVSLSPLPSSRLRSCLALKVVFGLKEEELQHGGREEKEENNYTQPAAFKQIHIAPSSLCHCSLAYSKDIDKNIMRLQKASLPTQGSSCAPNTYHLIFFVLFLF